MAWTVILEAEIGGDIIDQVDYFFTPEYDRKDLKLLKYLDPYGDAVFNQNQMEDLIADLVAMKASDAANQSLDEVIRLAKLCKEEEHTYLVFYGD
jgi:hypothetical protein